jgi:hypothetical protein
VNQGCVLLHNGLFPERNVRVFAMYDNEPTFRFTFTLR